MKRTFENYFSDLTLPTPDTLMTELAAVPVTTVRQDATALGREAARLLYRRLVSTPPRALVTKVIPTTLTIRASTTA